MIINWNYSPEIFTLGPIQLRWYGVLFLSGFLIGYRILQHVCRQENKPTEKLDELLIYLIVGTALGARLGHCLFYEFDYYMSHPWEILAIWKGGLASHGGGVGVLVSLFLFSRRNPEFTLWWLFDRIAFPTAMTGGFIRLGNLMNSEILGKPTDGTWGFVFERIDKIPRHPTQIYEAICYFIIAFIGYRVYARYKEQLPRGLVFGITFVGLYVVRFFLEFLKENQVPFEASLPLNMGQLLSLPYIAFGLFFIVRALREGPQSPLPSETKSVKKKRNKGR